MVHFVTMHMATLTDLEDRQDFIEDYVQYHIPSNNHRLRAVFRDFDLFEGLQHMYKVPYFADAGFFTQKRLGDWGSAMAGVGI
jgi:hypothetical protein